MIKKRSKSKTGDLEKGQKKEEEGPVVALSKSKKRARRGKERGYWDNLGLV